MSLRRLLLSISLLTVVNINAQICDPIVPSLIVDLTGQPNGTYTSPGIQRDGHCCGTTNPDKCIEFVVTLDPNTIGIVFDICEGAVPPGALFYQINCGPPTSVGSLACLSGPGPHIITFCKPGNNTNVYCITSVSNTPIPTDTICNINTPSTYSAELIPGATYNWSITSPGVILSGQDTNQVVVDWSAMTPGFYNDVLVVEIVSNCNTVYNYVDIYIPDVNIDFTQIGPYCLGDPCLFLYATPVGGTFSGTGVLGTAYCPSPVGIHPITYTYTQDGCTFTETINVEVNPSPNTSPITHN